MPFIKHIKPTYKYCSDPEHQPPSMQILELGVHVWQCPACGKQTSVVVGDATL